MKAEAEADPSDSIIYISSRSSSSSAFNSPGTSPIESIIGWLASALLELAPQAAVNTDPRIADIPAETIKEAAASLRQEVPSDDIHLDPGFIDRLKSKIRGRIDLVIKGHEQV